MIPFHSTKWTLNSLRTWLEKHTMAVWTPSRHNPIEGSLKPLSTMIFEQFQSGPLICNPCADRRQSIGLYASLLYIFQPVFRERKLGRSVLFIYIFKRLKKRFHKHSSKVKFSEGLKKVLVTKVQVLLVYSIRKILIWSLDILLLLFNLKRRKITIQRGWKLQYKN